MKYIILELYGDGVEQYRIFDDEKEARASYKHLTEDEDNFCLVRCSLHKVSKTLDEFDYT